MNESIYIDFARQILREAIKNKWIEKLANLFSKQHRILVLGSSGAGKSNLIESLENIEPKIIDAVNRTEFVQKQKIKIHNKPFEFVDFPGQEGHHSRRMTGIRDAIGNKGISGIINVVSYGYHEYFEGEERAINRDKKSINQRYLEDSRKLEIKAMQEWIPLLGSPEIGKWLITVITKADLWWDIKEDVFQHYKSGEYHQSLGDAKSLNQIVLHYSSVSHKFYKVGSLSSTFDQSDRNSARIALFNTLASSVS